MKKVLSFIIVVAMMLCMIPVANANVYGYLNENKIVYINLTPDYYCRYYSFYPDEAGYYRVVSYGNNDTYIFCHDEEGNEIAFDDDSGQGDNFNCVFYAQADTEYTIAVSAHDLDIKQYMEFEIMMTKQLKDEYAQEINLDEEHEVELKVVDRSRFFRFVPHEDDYYAFYTTGEHDTQAYLYDSQWNLIDGDDDSGEDMNCYLSRFLEKGKTYYFEVTNPRTPEYSYRMDVTVGLKKTAVVESINITSYPDKMSYYKGFIEEVENYVKFRGLECELVFTDGRKEMYSYVNPGDIIGATVETGFAQKDDGKYYVYVIAGYGYTEFYPEIVDVAVESLTLNTAPSREYVFSGNYGNTQIDNYGNVMFNFHPTDMSGMSFDVNFSDGTSVTYDYDDFEKGYSRVDGYRYSVDWVKISDHEFASKKVYEVTFNFLDHTLTYDVTLCDKISPRGDVDMDGKVSIMDATAIQMYLANYLTLNAAQLYTADVDGHGDTTILDATLIQRHVAHLWQIP